MAENKMIHGGDVLIKCLLKENVKYMFGIPGGHFLPMYDAIIIILMASKWNGQVSRISAIKFAFLFI
jgi:hypothetical protein